MQLWPANENALAAIACAAVSMSASSAMITGVALPSSSLTRFLGAPSASFQPTAPEPVKVSALTRSSSIKTSPISEAGPTRTFSQPGGRPASVSSSASSSAERGVWLAGFSTTAQPAASAGASLCATRLSGKLKGEIAPTPPQREGELAIAGLRGVHRHHLAGELAGLDGREGVVGHRAPRLDPRGLHWLARLVGDRASDLVVAAAEEACDPDEELGALVRGQRLAHRRLGGIDRPAGFVRSRLGHAAHGLAGERRSDVDPVAGLDPLAADQQLALLGGHGHEG